MKPIRLLLCAAALLAFESLAAQLCYDLADFGLRPDTGENATPAIRRALDEILASCDGTREVTVRLPAGRYDLFEEGAAERICYISNHDQTQSKRIGILIEGARRLRFDARGAEIVCHGRMLPVALIGTEACRLEGLAIDFERPHIAQIEIIANDREVGLRFRTDPGDDWRITPDSLLELRGEGWRIRPEAGMVFDRSTRRIVAGTGDVLCPLKGVREVAPGEYAAPAWHDARLRPGMAVVLRSYGRPAPGIFLDGCTDTRIERVTVRYAEGMGLLAQLCTDITLDRFAVRLRGGGDPRCFTTQADATHFSSCRGRIVSRRGLYEGMMDDAINVHGTYLKVTERRDDRTLVGRYMHDQSWGFAWGFAGDSVQIVRSRTMEPAGTPNRIAEIRPAEGATAGARSFIIRFEHPLPPEIGPGEGFGIENLTWTPEVLFADNIVRHNRARGALFSTPRRVVVERNLFDHVSGAAILLCGDCNGWYETGACRDVTIRRNRFVNALTSPYQFTRAVISIHPVIPDPETQRRPFHRNILIERNRFDTFDVPLLYALSVEGLRFRRNTVRRNDDFPPFGQDHRTVILEHCTDTDIEE